MAAVIILICILLFSCICCDMFSAGLYIYIYMYDLLILALEKLINGMPNTDCCGE